MKSTSRRCWTSRSCCSSSSSSPRRCWSKASNLKLPHGGQPEKQIDKSDIATVEITYTGVYALNKQRLPLPQLIARLAQEYRSNPNLVVYIRADKDGRLDLVAQLLDGCEKNGITRYSLRTNPTPD